MSYQRAISHISSHSTCSGFLGDGDEERAEHEGRDDACQGDRSERRDEASPTGRCSVRAVVLVRERVALAALEQVAIDRDRRDEGDGQNVTLTSPAFMAPGMAAMTALSTISMVRIDSVSAASTTVSAVRGARPDRSNGIVDRL